MALFGLVCLLTGFAAGLAFGSDFPFLEGLVSGWVGSTISWVTSALLGVVTGLAVSLLTTFVLWKHEAFVRFSSGAYSNFHQFGGVLLFIEHLSDDEYKSLASHILQAARDSREAGINLQRLGYKNDGFELSKASVDVLKAVESGDRTAVRESLSAALGLTKKMETPLIYTATCLAWQASTEKLRRFKKLTQ